MKSYDYIPILKAKKGELEALSHIRPTTAKRIMPLLGIPRISDAMRKSRKYRERRQPTCGYLDDIADQVARVEEFSEIAFDFYEWAPNSTTENNENVTTHFASALRERGVRSIAVVGYDRWEDPEYQEALNRIGVAGNGDWVIRFDSYAIDDFDDPEHFEEVVSDILDTLWIDPERCVALLDLGDVLDRSVESIQEIIRKAKKALAQWKWGAIALGGCSIPSSINLAVGETNSSALVLRREMVAWKSLLDSSESRSWIFSDYGIRSPRSADDIISPNTNGKIRYTTESNYFVVRGYPLRKGDKGGQYQVLSRVVIDSRYFKGAEFSWGDGEICRCADREFKGNGWQWVAIDTNHHLNAVIAEIVEARMRITSASNTERSRVDENDT